MRWLAALSWAGERCCTSRATSLSNDAAVTRGSRAARACGAAEGLLGGAVLAAPSSDSVELLPPPAELSALLVVSFALPLKTPRLAAAMKRSVAARVAIR